MWAALFLLVLLSLSTHAVHSATFAADLAILQQLRQGIQAADALLGWSATSADACRQWPHIQCDASGRVTGIAIAGRGLYGTLPASLAKLTSLQTLSLQRNRFSGAIPPLANLPSLQSVYLDGNSFTFMPPAGFSSLPALVSVNLDNNARLAPWSLPPDLAASTLLQNLSLTNSSLSGQIPAFLANLPSLQLLRLAYNRLSGSIPSAFGTSNLRIFQANNQLAPSQLSGSLQFLSTMQSLEQLWLQGNQFSGTIPTELAKGNPSLRSLRLNDNQLVGPIPGNFEQLLFDDLWLQNNHLDGQIPSITATQFTYDNNNFCQSTPGDACTAVVSALLQFLGSVNYPITIVTSWAGNDPCSAPWIGITCFNNGVSVLNLANSRLSGTISPSLTSITSLTIIKLNGNNLVGQIPSSLASLPSLRLLDLRDNRLSGPLPSFPKHVQVLTSGNPALHVLHSSPPRPISPKASPMIPLNPSPKRVPSVVTAPSSSPVKSISPISASPPVQSVSIAPAASAPPPSIYTSSGGASPLTENRAPTPSDNSPVAALHQKRSSSNISGVAAIFLVVGALVLLLFAPLGLFLLYKQKKRFIQVQSPNAVVIPPHVSDPDTLKLMVSARTESADNNTHEPSVRTNSGSNDAQVIEAGNLLISVQVLRNVTDNFSEANVLGRGGFGVVYKGKLDDGTKIAVKRMEVAIPSSKGQREFQAEIGVLTKVRHRHLVELLGYCIDENERLLVYEYMPQGALSKHLFDWAKQSNPKPLDWKKRLVIALDVARGMEYLHGLAQESFIHRDLKPSNILLDENFRAKVSDFGLVKLAPHGESIETRLAGTFGYLAPEYAVTGRVTTKSDVFSFGVVLMELITGRKALDENRPEESQHLVTWFLREGENKQWWKEAMDPALQPEEDEENLQSVCKVGDLARHCTATDPNKRPDMGHAVSILAPLVMQWKPSVTDQDGQHFFGIDLDLSLPETLKLWQASDSNPSSSSANGNDDTFGSLPSRPVGFADSFTSSDGR